ncbi:MAG: glycosyltransferase [Prevotella sp.]|nr:glycosyltransferase [Prevotella sp.]
MKKNVLFFINSEVGGAERMGVLISKMLINEGYNVEYVIVNDAQNKTSITDFIDSGHRIMEVKAENHLSKLCQFYKIIKQCKPECVFSTNYSVNDKLLLLRPLFRKVQFIARSDFYYSAFDWKEKLIIKLTYRNADVLIAQNEEMRQEFLEHKVLPTERVVTLENPVDKENIENKLLSATSPYTNDGRKHIIAVGRTSYQKGYDILVTALADIIHNGIAADLYIVGSNEGMWEQEYKRVQTIIHKLDIASYVHFVGYQENPYRYVKFADCFVLSSRWEGLPNVLAEALYLKIPVAACKCIPIVQRMVRDGVDGYLAEKENIQSLALAMKRALALGTTSPVYSGASNESFVQLFG